MTDHPDDQAIYALKRPHRHLLTWYVLISLLWGPFFPIAMFIMWRRYVTMTYHFDKHGITVSWGKLARREVSVLYARIQDSHLKVNFIERRLGLARLALQTAGGDAGAEITIQGFQEYEAIQRFLQRRTRTSESSPKTEEDRDAALIKALQQVTEELRGLRQDLAASQQDKKQKGDIAGVEADHV